MPPTTAQNLRDFHVAVPATAAPGTIFAVHPTQLYEVALMTIAFAVIWRARTSRRGTGWLLGLYLLLAGVERFGIEFLRAKDDRLPGGLSIAQLASIVMVVIGTAVIIRLSPMAAADPGTWLQTGAKGQSIPAADAT
jgi:phosphatidylglycerol:prolipoprotein diacylglycerol transferase